MANDQKKKCDEGSCPRCDGRTDTRTWDTTKRRQEWGKWSVIEMLTHRQILLFQNTGLSWLSAREILRARARTKNTSRCNMSSLAKGRLSKVEFNIKVYHTYILKFCVVLRAWGKQVLFHWERDASFVIIIIIVNIINVFIARGSGIHAINASNDLSVTRYEFVLVFTSYPQKVSKWLAL